MTETDAPSKSERTRKRILGAAAVEFRQTGYSARIGGHCRTRRHAGRQSLLPLRVARRAGCREPSPGEQAPSAVDVIDDAKPLLRLETAIRSLTMAVLQQSAYASAQAKIVGQVPPDIAKVGSRSAGLWRVMEWLVRRWCRCRGAAFGAGSVRGPHVGFWCYELEHRMVRSGSATVC
jgi:hypothetical protein